MNPFIFLKALSPRAWLEVGLAIALTLALATAGIERTRRAGVQAKFSDYRAKISAQETERTRTALADSQEVARLVARHATHQQDVIHAYYSNLLAIAADDHRRADAHRGLHDAATQFTANRGREAEGDSTACRLAKADVRTLTGLLVEGADLVSEGDGLLQRAAGEAILWHGIATNDRTLTNPTPEK